MIIMFGKMFQTKYQTYDIIGEDYVATDPEDAHEDAGDADAGPYDRVVVLFRPYFQRVHYQETVVVAHVR